MKNNRDNSTPEQLSSIIKCIYDAALDINEWSNVIANLTTLFDAHGGILRYINNNPNGQHFGEQVGYDEAYIEKYNDYYHKIDNFNTSLRGWEGRCITVSEYNFHDWFKNNDPFYHEFLVPYDVHNMMGANIIENEQGHFVLGLHRSLKSGAFSDTDVSMYNLLSPHLKKAVEIQNLLYKHQQQCKSGYDAINYLPFGIIFLDCDKKPIWHNRCAAEITSTGRSINITSDKVSCQSANESCKLSRMIDDALRKDQYHGGQMVLRDATANSTLFVVPLGIEHHQYSAIADQARAVIFIGDTSLDRKTSLNVLQMLYALTPAEARLVNGLCEGLTINEMEKEFGLSVNTLRSQLKTIFRKTGTNRQAELVRLVMTSPAILHT